MASLLDQGSILADVRLKLEAVRSEFGPLEDGLAAYLSQSGKMLRTRFTCALGEALGAPERELGTISLVAELVHNASLIHDDCIDRAALRRGLSTANAAFGETAAILLGDLAVAQAFRTSRSLAPESQDGLIEAIGLLIYGELLEDRRRKDLSLTEEEYLRIVGLKNGALFAWCARAAAVAAGLPGRAGDAAEIGQLTGLAHQLVDDALDLERTAAETGKDAFQDLRLGNLTLPLLRALAGDPSGSVRSALLAIWEGAPGAHPGALARRLVEEGVTGRVRAACREAVDRALALARTLPASPSTLETFLSGLSARER